MITQKQHAMHIERNISELTFIGQNQGCQWSKDLVLTETCSVVLGQHLQQHATFLRQQCHTHTEIYQ